MGDKIKHMRQEREDGCMDVPLQLIEASSEGLMKINEEVANIVAKTRHPITSISIVGKYRTGKSYIMNRIFDSNKGFELGPTTEATTKGIWIWIKPHPLDPQRTLLLMDTEGLHDPKKGDKTHDIKLFSLALMLSSGLVYNVLGNLDDTIIHELQLVSELTEHIRVSEDREEDGTQFSNYFPYLFILCRDFFLQMKDEKTTDDEYLEDSLTCRTVTSKSISEYNLPRECIKSFFKKRRCFTLSRPIDDEKKLQRLDKVQDHQIKREFLRKSKEAVTVILNETGPFEVIKDIPLNGKGFIQLAKNYVDCMNAGGIPCISNAVKLLKETECQHALDEALLTYDQFMVENAQNKMPITDGDLKILQKQARCSAEEVYAKRALLDEEAKYHKKLKEELQGKFQKWMDHNSKVSGINCQALLTKCFSDINKKSENGNYIVEGGEERYNTDMARAVDEYRKAPKKGPMAEELLKQHLESRKSEKETIINANKTLSEKKKQLAEQKAKTEAAEAKALRQQENFIKQQRESQQYIQDLRRRRRHKGKKCVVM